MKNLKIEEILKKNQLSNTPARREILNVLIAEHGPFSAEEIWQKTPQDLCDEATLFRTLKQFAQKNIIKTVQFDEDFKRYEYNHGHHHHHIKCSKCKKIKVLNCSSLTDFEQEAVELGFSHITHRLEFFGLCSECRI